MAYRSTGSRGELRCARCGSAEVIPAVPLADRYGDRGLRHGPLEVEVAGDPDAWLLRDAASGGLRARICGSCGFTELWTENHRELWEKHLAALERRGEGGGAPEEDEPLEPGPPGGVGEGGDCLSCGAAIPDGADRCPACGWSWGASRDEPDEGS